MQVVTLLEYSELQKKNGGLSLGILIKHTERLRCVFTVSLNLNQCNKYIIGILYNIYNI